MDKINKYNYEAFFLDYVEGNLTPEHQRELEEFLTKHSNLKAELDAYENIQLSEQATEEIFQNKILLKRDEQTTLSKVETLLIASIEGVLTDEESQELSTFLIDPTVLTQLSNYQKVKLKADPSLIYPLKHSLKKKQTFTWKNSYKYAAAAAIFIALFWIKQTPEKRYDLRVLQLPIEEKMDAFKLQLPVYSAKKSNAVKKEGHMEPFSLPDKSSIIAAVKQIPVKGPRKITIPKPEQINPVLQQSLAVVPDKINHQAKEVEKNSEENFAYESLEYSTLPGILLEALNKNLFNDQVNFNQKRNSKGKSKGFALVIGEIELSHTKSN